MKLTPVNPNWQVQKYATHDLSLAEGRARANSARAWGNVYEGLAHDIKIEADNVTKARQEAEIQKLYNQGIEQVNELENTLYTEQQLPMDSPLMTEVQYDDSYEYVENGVNKVGNRGYASIHSIGNDVWKTQSMAIAKAWTNQGSTDSVRAAVASKMQAQLVPKSQSVGRHVLNLATADRRNTVSNEIEDSVRNGDLKGALAIAGEAYNSGLINQKEYNDHEKQSYQQTDMIQYRQALSITEDEDELSDLSESALFDPNWMTPSQKASLSNAALQKIDDVRARRKEERAERFDNNEMDAIISFHRKETTVTELVNSSSKYSRAGFTRLYNRMTNPNPTVSNPLILDDYQRQIIDAPFISSPDNSMETISRGIMVDMRDSVLAGSLSPEDFEKNRVMLEEMAKAPFKTQPYQQAKKSLFVDILGTMDPATLEEIQGAGVNIDSMLLQAMGQKPNVSVLSIRAFEDLNQYMRTFGSQADPIQWWKDNKDAYKIENYVKESASRYSATYGADTVKLSNGQVDIKSTEDHIIRQYNAGAFGVTGSPAAMKELNKRASLLKGVPYE